MSDIDDELLEAYETLGIGVGDVFEDCAFHPVLCLGADYKEDSLWGISLIDGSQPRCCSLLHCGVRKLTLEEAWLIKAQGPEDEFDREAISLDRRWWDKEFAQSSGLKMLKTSLPEKLEINKENKG